MKSAYFLHIFTALAVAAPAASPAISCVDVTIPVQASAKNKALLATAVVPNLTDASQINSYFDSLPDLSVNGTYTIAARYCQPSAATSRRKGHAVTKPLQILVHGATYTRDYWSGFDAPGTSPGQEKYSWVEYAAQQGYPTLSIDRLCNGASSHPNGLTDCQLPLEAETIVSVITAARNGTIRGINRRFAKIIYVGHSVGSQVGNALSIQHPEAIDALLLTGWSDLYYIGVTGPAKLAGYQPVQVADPGTSNLDPTYLRSTSYDGVKTVFYYGDYLETVARYDFDHRQTVAQGEAATSLLGASTAADYNGPVFVLNGNEDLIFCPTSLTGPSQGQPGDCTQADVSSSAAKVYPNARSFQSHFIPRMGHCLNTHENAKESFKVAHDWMDSLQL